jgi:hypothetical protein
MNERAVTAEIGSPIARRGFTAALFDAMYESRRRHASHEIQKHRQLLGRAKFSESPRAQRICVAIGRPVRLQWEYRRSLSELVSLSDGHLRELRIGASYLPDIACSEACRRVDATTAQSAGVGITVLACVVAAAASLMLFSL